MEQKILREWKPEWKTNVNDVLDKLGAEYQDSLVSSRKIRQEIVAKDDISNAFDGITYQKGASVIGMFEHWVGPETFRKGVKSYLTQYAFRNASAPEFLDAISSAGKKNVNAAFSSFLNQAGIPLVSVELDCKQASPTLHLEQQRFVPLGSKAPDQTWQIPMCVRYGSGLTGETACELMTQPKQDLVLKTSSCPAWVEGNDKALGYYDVDYKGGLLKSLAEGEVDKRLSAPERVDFMGDVLSLSNAGKVDEGDALAMVQTFSADPERHVVQTALRLALTVREHGVPDSLLPNYRRFLQKNFQARAREIGWTPKPGESNDVSLLRATLLRLMSTWGDDQQLAAQGKELADKWLKDHSAVNPNLVDSVLDTAAFYGDKAYFDALVDNLKTTTDRQERQSIIGSMSSFRDPAAINAAFDALLTGKVPFLEGARLLFLGQSSDATRKMPLDFLKTHYDQILAMAPTGGGFDMGGVLPYVGASYCDASSKAELRDYFEPKVGKLLGARRNLDQVLESIDGCIAQTAQQRPSIEAFLQKY